MAGQREGNAGRAARKLADQRRKWPQEAVSTELPGGWRCPWFSVGHLSDSQAGETHVLRAPGDLRHCGEAM